MTKQDLKKEYFNWMYGLVCSDKRFRKTSYKKLLKYLHSVEFSYIICMDGNRAEDGVDLRYRFGYENSIPDYEIADGLDDRPCSILEMMTALSIRCEENIMDNPEIGDRTGQWFWGMIKSLGLYFMDDSEFERSEADKIIRRFLNHEYESNGKGGLFTVRNCRRDLRSVEIWYQAMWYLDEVLEN
ncbi:MAG: hypothetical protein II931_02980 [Clostridia bacterium]|nr:hypothetical protein [Clostridia bacterium]